MLWHLNKSFNTLSKGGCFKPTKPLKVTPLNHFSAIFLKISTSSKCVLKNQLLLKNVKPLSMHRLTLHKAVTPLSIGKKKKLSLQKQDPWIESLIHLTTKLLLYNRFQRIPRNTNWTTNFSQSVWREKRKRTFNKQSEE